MRDGMLSRYVLVFLGGVLWGRAIISPSFNDSIVLEIAMALLGSMFLAWLGRSWLSVAIIPVGYAAGMLFVRQSSPESVDITLTEALIFVLLSIIGAAIGEFIGRTRRRGAEAG